MIRELNTLIIGSGAAGLAAAVRLHAQKVENIAIYTEGLKMGTSINTGSDKQTYYKLGMYGAEGDSPYMMAKDLSAGGSVHGDLALVEASLSPLAFHHLVSLGVPFPHDAYGQYAGYKTDHDPKRRATSCGPYTSRDMCRSLIDDVQRRGICVEERRLCHKLLTDQAGTRVIGAIFLNMETGAWEAVKAENVIFATGGPGGLYAASVYPKVHTGGIGIALEAGARAYNLAESQFGLASIKFRWNVSGSYMQVLPRFVSTDQDGNEEREFLREYFATPAEMYDAIFLKGYQWPFSAGHVPGSSLIDIFTYIETVERGRRVWLDYRSDPADLEFSALNEETRTYLERSGAWEATPLKRLELLNAPAIELYRRYGIPLEKEMLEIAVCAQHNNGGLAGNLWWESVNLKHLFPIGEVNGSHGVTRPGGSALNAGQVGAFRASEFIAAKYQEETFSGEEFTAVLNRELALLTASQETPAQLDWKAERQKLQLRMSKAGAFVRSVPVLEEALNGVYQQYEELTKDGLGGLEPKVLADVLRNRQLCYAQIYYLECILMQIDYIGSRGGSMVLNDSGKKISPLLDDKWKIQEEKKEMRDYVMFCVRGEYGAPTIGWEKCRPVPEEDGWFENIWREFRTGEVYGRGNE